MNFVMCVFCENVYDDVFVCGECQDYKGLMPIGEAVPYLDLDPKDFVEFL